LRPLAVAGAQLDAADVVSFADLEPRDGEIQDVDMIRWPATGSAGGLAYAARAIRK
jgi:hypothetical protein